MNRALLFQLWVFVIGFLFSNLHKRTFDPVFRTLIALPIGWALFGICAIIVYSVYFSAVSQMVLLVVLALTTLVLLFANIREGSLSRDSILLGGASLAVLTGACFFVDLLRIVTMTADSSYIARFGQNLGLGNYEASRVVFSMWGPLVPFIHSITNLLDQKLFWQYQPILSVNLLALVFYTIYTVIRGQKSKLQSVIAATVLVSESGCALSHALPVVKPSAGPGRHLPRFGLFRTQFQRSFANGVLLVNGSDNDVLDG